jgi:hypothetical protein
MVFAGESLQRVLLKQSDSVSVFDKWGFHRGSVSPSTAAALALKENSVGIGRKNRIYDIQPSETRPKQDQELLGPNPTARRITPVTKNLTQHGAKEWRPRPDNAQTGTFGTDRTIHFRE